MLVGVAELLPKGVWFLVSEVTLLQAVAQPPPPPLLPVVLQVLSAPSRSPCSSSSISYCPAGLTGFLCPVASLCRPCSVGLLLDAWSPTSSKGASFLLCIHIAAWSTGPPVSNFAVHLPISLPVTSAWITSIRGPLH